MKKLSTQVILEHEFNDTAVDLSVQKLQIRTVGDDLQNDEDLFRKVLSCPLDDVCTDPEILKLTSFQSLEKQKVKNKA